MAGRGGRGGGRGRGRGTMSFDARDLGIMPGEQIPGPALQPPPTFPSLEFQPAPLNINPEMEYMIALKKDFAIFLKDNLPQVGKSAPLGWRFLPAELQGPQRKKANKRGAGAVTSKSKKANVDLKALDALAILEEKSDEKEGTKDEEEGKKKEGDEDAEEGEGEEEEMDDIDEEMDDGTDYVNNYFDNGEGLDDDDDNPNDGPIY